MAADDDNQSGDYRGQLDDADMAADDEDDNQSEDYTGHLGNVLDGKPLTSCDPSSRTSAFGFPALSLTMPCMYRCACHRRK